MSQEEFIEHILPLKNKVYRFVLSYLHREAEAKDVVQEVLLTAWEKIKDPNSIKSLDAWCMTLARNKSLNLLKKKGRNYLDISDQYNLISRDANPLKQTENQESFQKIKAIISTLPQQQQEVIRLRDMEGYSYKEIAQILKLEMNHVKVLLFRARKRVKEELIRENDYGISHAR